MQDPEAADRTGDAFALLGWLEAASLLKLAPALEANEVASIEDLLDLTPEDVKELVPPVGLRNRFLKVLAHLRADQVVQQPSRAAAAVAPTTQPAPPASSAASGVPKSYTTPYLVDSQYVAERHRREASRVRQRQQNLAQERERWMQLLKRTVAHPSAAHSDSATRRRDEERKRTEARRRSLSRGTTRTQSPSAAHRTPLRAARRTASAAGPSPASARGAPAVLRTPAFRSAAPSPFCGSAAAPVVGRTPRLRPSCPRRGSTPPAAASPGRRRVWLRSTASPAVSTPPQPPAAAAAAEAEQGEGNAGNSPQEAVLSPSPPPPSGSPSPEAILNARRFAACSEPVGVPTLACVEDGCDTEEGDAEPQSVQRNRLLTLIEQNKQQRLRYWIEPKSYVSPCGTEEVWDEVKQP